MIFERGAFFVEPSVIIHTKEPFLCYFFSSLFLFRQTRDGCCVFEWSKYWAVTELVTPYNLKFPYYQLLQKIDSCLTFDGYIKYMTYNSTRIFNLFASQINEQWKKSISVSINLENWGQFYKHVKMYAVIQKQSKWEARSKFRVIQYPWLIFLHRKKSISKFIALVWIKNWTIFFFDLYRSFFTFEQTCEEFH